MRADAPDSRGDERPETAGRRGGFGGHGGRGGYGGRGGFGGGHRGAPPEAAAADRARILEAVGDARSPSPSLSISHSPANVAITDARGRTRFFQTNGAKDKHQLEAGTIDSTTSWNGDLLVTQYDLGGGRRLTYTYSLLAETKQLVVRVHVDRAGQSGGHGGPNTKYVYDAVRRK